MLHWALRELSEMLKRIVPWYNCSTCAEELLPVHPFLLYAGIQILGIVFLQYSAELLDCASHFSALFSYENYGPI